MIADREPHRAVVSLSPRANRHPGNWVSSSIIPNSRLSHDANVPESQSFDDGLHMSICGTDSWVKVPCGVQEMTKPRKFLSRLGLTTKMGETAHISCDSDHTLQAKISVNQV